MLNKVKHLVRYSSRLPAASIRFFAALKRIVLRYAQNDSLKTKKAHLSVRLDIPNQVWLLRFFIGTVIPLFRLLFFFCSFGLKFFQHFVADQGVDHAVAFA